MSQWSDRLANHAIWQVLNSLGPALDNAQAREGVDAASLESLARVRSVLAFIGKRLAGADAHLVHPGPLDQVANNLQATTTEVQAFVSNGNTGHLANANNYADAALTYLVQVNVPFTTEEFVGAKEATESYRRGVEGALTEVQSAAAQTRAELASTKTRLAELAGEMNTEKQRLSSLAAEYQAQFSNAQETRNRESATQQKEQQDRFAALVAEHTQIFLAKASEFTSMLDAAQRQQAERLDSLSKEFVGGAESIRAALLKRQEEVEKLVGVIGNLAVTSGYQKAAAAARRALRFWQVVAVAAMLGFIAIAVFAFLPGLSNGFSWSAFAGRVFISFTVGVLAAYAASQADKYQKAERHAEKLALELEALGPFLAPLPQEKQEAFRLTIGERSFGHEDGALSRAEASPATLMHLIGSKEFRELITDVVKAAK